jgi:uncharacterized protein (DUF488 family)
VEDNLSNIQRQVLIIVDKWVRSKKTPVPRNHIIDEMTKNGVESYTTIFSLNSVMSKGYIRRAITQCERNKTLYVQLRTIHYD